MSCDIGRRHSLDPALHWLWCRLAAVAPIKALAWELPLSLFVKKYSLSGSSQHGLAVMNPTSIHEEAGLIPGLSQWVKDTELP